MKSPSIHQTPLYRAKAAYANMVRRCKGGVAVEAAYSEVEVRFTLEEWLVWAVPRYRRFIRKYPNETPSVSRNGDVGHYEIGNVKIISFRKNLKMRKPGEPIPNRDRRTKCVCGRVFLTTKSYAGHRRWCEL